MEPVNDSPICRLCLHDDERLIYIFQKHPGQRYVPAKVIKDLLQIQVSKSDGYPPFACLRCFDKLTDIRHFRELCLQSLAIYDSLLSSKTICQDSPIETQQSQSGAGDGSAHRVSTGRPQVQGTSEKKDLPHQQNLILIDSDKIQRKDEQENVAVWQTHGASSDAWEEDPLGEDLPEDPLRVVKEELEDKGEFMEDPLSLIKEEVIDEDSDDDPIEIGSVTSDECEDDPVEAGPSEDPLDMAELEKDEDEKESHDAELGRNSPRVTRLGALKIKDPAPRSSSSSRTLQTGDPAPRRPRSLRTPKISDPAPRRPRSLRTSQIVDPAPRRPSSSKAPQSEDPASGTPRSSRTPHLPPHKQDNPMDVDQTPEETSDSDGSDKDPSGPEKRVVTFKTKLEIVQKLLKGFTSPMLSQQYDLPPSTIRSYKNSPAMKLALAKPAAVSQARKMNQLPVVRKELEEKVSRGNSKKTPLLVPKKEKSLNKGNSNKTDVSSRDLTCKHCGKEHLTFLALNRHAKKCSGKKKPLKMCPVCKLPQTNMWRHMKNTHNNEKPFKCGYCTSSFFTMELLRLHSAEHTLTCPYVCRICGRGYKIGDWLAKHMSLKHLND